MNESEKQTEKGLAHAHWRWEWLRRWIYLFLKALLNYSSTACVGFTREESRGEGRDRKCVWEMEREMATNRHLGKQWQVSVIQQHLLLLPLKLLWDLKAPGLSCSPGTASDPCLAYTANRNAYLHQPSQLKRSPSVSTERRM